LRRKGNLPILSWENAHRNQPVDVPGLSYCEGAAFPTPQHSGLSIWRGGSFTLALRGLRNAISRAPRAVAQHALRALRPLRKPGAATDFAGLCSGDHLAGGAGVADSGAALRSLPAQIFFRKAAATRKRKRPNCAGRLIPGNSKLKSLAPDSREIFFGRTRNEKVPVACHSLEYLSR